MKFSWLMFIVLIFTPYLQAEWVETKVQKEPVFVYTPLGEGLRPLLISLHGCNQNAEQMVKYGNWESIAEEHNMVVIAPQVLNGVFK